jgi:hypothetical protein
VFQNLQREDHGKSLANGRRVLDDLEIRGITGNPRPGCGSSFRTDLQAHPHPPNRREMEEEIPTTAPHL